MWVFEHGVSKNKYNNDEVSVSQNVRLKKWTKTYIEKACALAFPTLFGFRFNVGMRLLGKYGKELDFAEVLQKLENIMRVLIRKVCLFRKKSC